MVEIKRIWFVQQKPYNYMPLMAGLGLITPLELEEVSSMHTLHDGVTLCPKIYTTRKSPLKGEYVVVEGSRFKATPVEPRIEFQVKESYRLSLRDEFVATDEWGVPVSGFIDPPSGLTFPELDLGFRGVTFEGLKTELLKLNQKATLDTPFYINRLVSMGAEVTGGGK